MNYASLAGSEMPWNHAHTAANFHVNLLSLLSEPTFLSSKELSHQLKLQVQILTRHPQLADSWERRQPVSSSHYFGLWFRMLSHNYLSRSLRSAWFNIAPP